jgi:hypothetical protein
MSAKRKPNWNAGLTRAQKAIADQISIDQIAAFERERAAGTFGAPGSVWQIGPDGLATHCGLAPKNLPSRSAPPAATLFCFEAEERLGDNIR